MCLLVDLISIDTKSSQTTLTRENTRKTLITNENKKQSIKSPPHKKCRILQLHCRILHSEFDFKFIGLKKNVL